MAWRFGYRTASESTPVILVTDMNNPHRGCKNDPYDWGDRTFQIAHDYIEKHWDSLKSGDLIDVLFILGESLTPCESEA
jgi:hypothetical protein